jgi:hypothetical protein
MKSVATLIAAFLGILFFEGFARIVITFYHRIEFQFFGVSGLPGIDWVVIILMSVLISTWLLTMLILTIIDQNSFYYALAFWIMLMFWRGFEIFNSYSKEPLWYFIIIIFLHTLGVFLAFKLYKHQNEIIQDS